MADALHRILTALWETLVLFWPIWFIFVAAMSLSIGYFVLLLVRDEKRETARQRIPNAPGPFDQDQLDAWTPTGPEAWADYRRFHRGHRKERAAARRSVA